MNKDIFEFKFKRSTHRYESVVPGSEVEFTVLGENEDQARARANAASSKLEHGRRYTFKLLGVRQAHLA